MICVACLDDHELLVEGIRREAEKQPDILVVQSFTSGTTALETIVLEDVDVLVCDISLPDMLGFEVVAALRKTKPDLGVIYYTMHSEDKILRGALSQTTEICEKGSSPSQLFAKIRAMYARTQTRNALAQRNLPDLTKREREVLDLFRDGESMAEIGRTLSIERATVAIHIKKICKKFGVTDSQFLR